jgi:hypothetical protein
MDESSKPKSTEQQLFEVASQVLGIIGPARVFESAEGHLSRLTLSTADSLAHSLATSIAPLGEPEASRPANDAAPVDDGN